MVKRFNYRGFVVNFEEGSFKLYTRDEWSYGKGYRYPEWETDNEDEAREWIDSYHMEDVEERYDFSDDQFEATNPSSIGQHKRSSFDIIDVTEDDEEFKNYKIDTTDIDRTLEDEEETDKFGRTNVHPHGYLPYI